MDFRKENSVIISDSFLKRLLVIDRKKGGLTTKSAKFGSEPFECIWTARQSLIVCGISVLQNLYHMIDPSIDVRLYCKEGDELSRGKMIASASGSYQTLAKGSRVALQILQQFSGISTLSYQYEKKIYRTKTKIIEPRVDVPEWENLERFAAGLSGKRNHRLSPYDESWLKLTPKNKPLKSFQNSIRRLRKKSPESIVVVEIDRPTQVEIAIEAGADRLSLKLTNHQKIKECVGITNHRIPIEISAPLKIGDLKSISNLGVEYISTQSIISSAFPAKIGLKIAPQEFGRPI